MANNTIQIKRSATTAAPASLNPGELAYSNAVGGSGVLFIGSTDGATVVPIGGARTPGTLTANQAIVANSTSGVNRILAANVDALSYLNVNGGPGTSGFILYSGGASANAYWGSTSAVLTNVNAQYAWTNTHTFSNTISFGSIVNIGNSTITIMTDVSEVVQSNTGLVSIKVANGTAGATNTVIYPYGIAAAVNVAVGSITTSSNGALLTNALLQIGNTSVYSNVTPGSLISTGNVITTTVLATGLVNAANFVTTGTVNTGTVYATGLVNAANFVTTGTVNTGTVYATGLVNAANFVTTGTVNTGTVYATGAVNAANFSTTGNVTVGTVSASSNGALILPNVIQVGNTSVYTNVIPGSVLTTGNVVVGNATNYANIGGGDITITGGMTVGGNLVVSGSVVTVNTSTLIVNDNIIELAYNNLTTDLVDTGVYSPAGNATNSWYSGVFRIAASSNSTVPYFKILSTTTNPNTSTTVGGTITTGTLESYLAPYGTGGGFVVNSSAIIITANSSVVANITANNITLSTALATGSGGTGLNSYAAGDLLYYNSGTALSKLSVPGSAANGQVLQITNNLPAYGTLDGGTF